MSASKVTICGAIAANVAIAATKFAVAGITGSSAMLSEGIHSAVDTFNGILLPGNCPATELGLQQGLDRQPIGLRDVRVGGKRPGTAP